MKVHQSRLFLLVLLLTMGCPQVDRITPTTVNVGDVVDLRDPDDSTLGTSGVVYFGSVPVASEDVLSWSGTDVFVKVPEGVSGSVWVRVETGPFSSNLKEVEIVSNPVALRFLCFGDSNTYRRYPEILQSLIWEGTSPASVINQGKPAEHIAHAPTRFEEALQHHGYHQDLDFIILMEGTNDVLDQSGIGIPEMQGALMDMVYTVPVGVQLVLATVVPLVGSCGDEFSPTIQDWNDWLRDYALSEGIPLVDIHEAIVSTQGWETLYFNEEDCIHPNHSGDVLMADLFSEAILSLLQ